MKMDTDKPKVAVTGANGYTSSFIIPDLMRRGFTPVAIARNADALRKLPYDEQVIKRQASFDDPESFDRALDDVKAIIHAAGPFAEKIEVVAQAAIKAKIHYVDVAAEQGSTKLLFDKYNDQAKIAGVVLIPSLGLFGGMSDLIASSLVGDWDSVDEIETYVGFDKWHPTAGTRNTINSVGDLQITNGKLVPKSADEQKSWTFANPLNEQTVVAVPFPESIQMLNHIKVTKHRNYLSLIAVQDVLNPETPFPKAADDMGRSSQTFVVDVVVRRGHEVRRAHVRGKDGYAVTAPLTVLAIQRLLAGEFSEAGVKAPGDAFADAGTILKELAPDYAIYEVDEPKALTGKSI